MNIPHFLTGNRSWSAGDVPLARQRKSVGFTALLCVGLGIMSIGMGGCMKAQNDRVALGNALVLPAFQANHPMTHDNTPGNASFDRSAWMPMEFSIPVHGVAHNPVYTEQANTLHTLARQRGEYPTAQTALELGEPDTPERVLQTARAHGMAGLDALLLVPRIIMRPPWETDWSPGWNYQRQFVETDQQQDVDATGDSQP